MTSFDLDLTKYQLGWSDEVEYAFTPEKGINDRVVDQISWWKGEPRWMTNMRLRSLKLFERKPMAPWFAVNMPTIDFQDIYYYLRPSGEQVDEWDDLPEQMKATYEKLGIPEAERQYLSGVTAQYECLRGDTEVWTTRGMRRIKELAAGDEVFSLDAERRKVVVARVTGGGSSGAKEVFEIRAGGRTIGASANHPFYVLRDERKAGRVRARYQPRWVAVEDLRVGDLVAVPTDLPEFGRTAALDARHVHAGFGFTNPDLCWFLGYYLGDGFLKHSDGYVTVQIAVDRTDERLVDELCRIGRDEFQLDFALSADGYRLTARGTAPLASFLEANGLGGKSLTKRVPEWVFGLPTEQRLAFLAGYIDADGTVRAHKTAKNPVLTSANETLLTAIRELALLCGIGVSAVGEFRQPHVWDASTRDGRLSPASLRSLRQAAIAVPTEGRPTRPAPVCALQPHRQGHGLHSAHQRHARLRPDHFDRVGRHRGDLRHRGRGSSQLRRRGLRGPQLGGRLPPQPRGAGEAGDPVLRHGHRAARVPRPRQALLRHDHPAWRQQVRRAEHVGVVGRLVHLRPAGRGVRDAAAGVLPDQRRERRAVRAHADHRRRGLAGALHRGLLGTGVHERLAALGGRRDRRQAAALGSPTRRSRTGARTSTTSSPSGRGSRPRGTWNGSTATSGASPRARRSRPGVARSRSNS